jgi:hypothetical protein
VGASNALSAFRLYAAKVPPTALNVLVFMALVAMDRDDPPRYWLGHEALAVHCLGRDEASITDSDLRAVRRAITPLFEAGAITVARHSSGNARKHTTVEYQLHLVTPASDEKRPVDNRPAPDGNRPSADGVIGRNAAEHRTKSGSAPDGNRPAKEDEEEQEREKPEEYPPLSSDSAPVRAREASDGSGKTAPARVKPLWPAAVPPPGAPVSQADDPGEFEAFRQAKLREFEAWMAEHPEAS